MKELFITIKKGKILPEKSDSIWYALESLRDGLYTLKLSRVGTRNNQQNRYYFWVVLKLIADYTGEYKDDLHEEFKQRFWYDENIVSTTEMNKTIFSEYVENIKNYAMQKWNILIPDAVS
jgi:hypothetical protein